MTGKPNDEHERHDDMEGANFGYRLQRLEEEFFAGRIANRMQSVEMGLAQIQGEVVALKEIARGIGTKLDSGMRELSSTISGDINGIKMDQAKNQSFMRGILWIGGLVVSVVGPVIGLIIQHFFKG